MYQGAIQVVEAPILTSDEFVSISVTDAQTLVLQTVNFDAYVAYSEGGLLSSNTRFILKQQDGIGNVYEADLVLTFPHKPYSGTLWFASKNNTDSTQVKVWSFSCGGGLY